MTVRILSQLTFCSLHYQNVIFFSVWIKPQFIYTLSCWWTIAFFPKFLVIKNSTAVSGCSCTCAFYSCAWIAQCSVLNVFRTGAAGVICTFSLHLALQNDFANFHLKEQCMRVPVVLYAYRRLLISGILSFCASDGYEMSLIWISIITSEENLFTRAVLHSIISSNISMATICQLWQSQGFLIPFQHHFIMLLILLLLKAKLQHSELLALRSRNCKVFINLYYADLFCYINYL